MQWRSGLHSSQRPLAIFLHMRPQKPSSHIVEGFAPHPPPKAFLKITTQVSPTIMVTSLLLELNASFCELAVMIYAIFEEINTSSFGIAC